MKNTRRLSVAQFNVYSIYNVYKMSASQVCRVEIREFREFTRMNVRLLQVCQSELTISNDRDPRSRSRLKNKQATCATRVINVARRMSLFTSCVIVMQPGFRQS